jgi:protoporphyrinogen oxidase
VERSIYDAVILGAGPSGLTAAYCLARQGLRALVVERSRQVGGLMRGVQRGEFRLDLGRKDLHADRFPGVHALWTGMLGADYVACPRHVGVLYGGRILEKYSGPKGRLRGMSAAQALSVAAGALWSQVKPGSRTVRKQADYYVLRYGKPFYDYFVAGFQQKFDGELPPDESTIPRFAVLRERLQRSRVSAKGPGSHHPALGTQQIVDALWRGAREGGAEFAFDAEALALNVEDGKLASVVIREGGGARTLQTRHVVAGLPVPVILGLLRPGAPAALRNPPREEKALTKSTALVYLFADREPAFPHSWLEVTDPRLRMGRVTSYSAWGGRMVPAGKTALGIEFFAQEGDDVMALSKEALLELAISEAAANGLIERARVFDHLVFQMPRANATTLFTDWRTPWMQQARGYLRGIEGLFETHRPGMDRACLAGIDAADACVAGRAMSERSLEDAGTARAAPPRPAAPLLRRYAYGS